MIDKNIRWDSPKMQCLLHLMHKTRTLHPMLFAEDCMADNYSYYRGTFTTGLLELKESLPLISQLLDELFPEGEV